MTQEELLAPRYEVIAPYPYSPYKVGDLVGISDIGTSFHCTTTQQYSEFDGGNVHVENYFSIKLIDTYPHLFRRLNWWEKRNVEDIGFVSVNSDWHYGVSKAVRILSDHWGNAVVRLEGWKFDVQLRYCLPATLEEYTNYINKSK